MYLSLAGGVEDLLSHEGDLFRVVKVLDVNLFHRIDVYKGLKLWLCYFIVYDIGDVFPKIPIRVDVFNVHEIPFVLIVLAVYLFIGLGVTV